MYSLVYRIEKMPWNCTDDSINPLQAAFLKRINLNNGKKSWSDAVGYSPHPAKIDLNKKWLPKQKTIQNFNIDALGFRKTRNENPPTREIGVSS